MATTKQLHSRIAKGLREMRILVESPDSPEADAVLANVVARYNGMAFEAIAAQDLLLHPRWPQWHRALQVRFLQLACADRESIRIAVRKVLENGNRPLPDRLMREVVRVCLFEIIEWGKSNKDKPQRLQGLRPIRPDNLWNAAWRLFDRDVRKEMHAGRTIQSAPENWFDVLGVDYSLKSVPN